MVAVMAGNQAILNHKWMENSGSLVRELWVLPVEDGCRFGPEEENREREEKNTWKKREDGVRKCLKHHPWSYCYCHYTNIHILLPPQHHIWNIAPSQTLMYPLSVEQLLQRRTHLRRKISNLGFRFSQISTVTKIFVFPLWMSETDHHVQRKSQRLKSKEPDESQEEKVKEVMKLKLGSSPSSSKPSALNK